MRVYAFARRERETETDRQTDRQTDTHTHTHTHSHTFTHEYMGAGGLREQFASKAAALLQTPTRFMATLGAQNKRKGLMAILGAHVNKGARRAGTDTSTGHDTGCETSRACLDKCPPPACCAAPATLGTLDAARRDGVVGTRSGEEDEGRSEGGTGKLACGGSGPGWEGRGGQGGAGRWQTVKTKWLDEEDGDNALFLDEAEENPENSTKIETATAEDLESRAAAAGAEARAAGNESADLEDSMSPDLKKGRGAEQEETTEDVLEEEFDESVSPDDGMLFSLGTSERAHATTRCAAHTLSSACTLADTPHIHAQVWNPAGIFKSARCRDGGRPCGKLGARSKRR